MSIFDEEKKWLLQVYSRLPLEIDRGDGVYLYDKNGKKYLDLLSGLGVNALGYNHPYIINAIQQQLTRNLHLSNYFVQDVQVNLAKVLVSLTSLSKVFFTNSGTEAIEGILKLVKKWAIKNNKNAIYSLSGSFHGRTLGALSLTAQQKYQKHFLPLLSNIQFLPFNDINALVENINDQTAAIFLELIKGEGGIVPISESYINKLLELKNKFNFLIVDDEIQAGIGRTSKFYAYEHYDFKPDIIATAKPLGGGLPLGAFIVSEQLRDIFDTGEHGTTFGGNPLACSAGLATIHFISNSDFLTKVELISKKFINMLFELKTEFGDYIKDIRGQGLMLGMEINDKAKQFLKEAIKCELILNVTSGNTSKGINVPTI